MEQAVLLLSNCPLYCKYKRKVPELLLELRKSLLKHELLELHV